MRNLLMKMLIVFLLVSRMTFVHADTGNVVRVFGKSRYDTSFGIALQLKEKLQIETFDAVVLASGRDFADALAGSVLAAKKNAPVLMCDSKNNNISEIKKFLDQHMNPDGIVYVLGGTGALGDFVESGLSGYQTKRLYGQSRYETNLEIIKEAGISDEPLLVCNAKNFADSLSASATGLPLFLVGSSLNQAQKSFLNQYQGKQFYILGGTGAVSDEIENQLKAYGDVERIAGKTRYQTSVLIAEKFMPEADSIVLAYAKNYPDGLCGGPLAYAMNASLILVDSNVNNVQSAIDFSSEKGITQGIVLGGSSLISDDMVQNILDFYPAHQRYPANIQIDMFDIAAMENVIVHGNAVSTKAALIDYVLSLGFRKEPVIQLIENDLVAGTIVDLGQFELGTFDADTVFTIQVSAGHH